MEIEAGDRRQFFRAALEGAICILTDPNAMDTETTNLDNNDDSLDSFGNRKMETVKLCETGYDDEELLVNILNELLYQCQVNKWRPVNIKNIDLAANEIAADIFAVRQDREFGLEREIKAATYHSLKIQTKPDWRAKIVFDV